MDYGGLNNKNIKMNAPEKINPSPDKLPTWFKTLTILTLIPVGLWPLMLFSACFVDSPNPSFGLQLISFIMLFFPFIVGFLFYLARKLFPIQKNVAVSIPVVILSIYAICIISLIILILGQD